MEQSNSHVWGVAAARFGIVAAAVMLLVGMYALSAGSASAAPVGASLTIAKECASADTTTTFTINISGPTTTSVTLACGAQQTVQVGPGAYTISETPPTGYQQPSIRGACDGNGTVTLADGGSGTCVVRNTKLANLTLTKECQTADATTLFAIHVTGPGALGDQTASLNCGGSQTVQVEANRTYTVSETPPAGYQEPSIRGACDGNGTVSLAPGASGTCVVHNTKLATVTIQKECAQGDTGTGFVIHLTGPGKYGDQTVTLNCGASSTPLTVEALRQYTVSEVAKTGYQNPPNIRGLCDGNGTMTADPGTTNTCVVSNVLLAQTATLRITKECATADANTQFTINLTGPNGAPVSLACGATSNPLTINANTTYTVSETPPTGYQDPSIRGACDGNGTVSLAPNASGTCVVRNTKLATVVLQKECAQGDNGTGFVIHLTGPGKYGDQSATLNCGQSSSALTVEANVQYTVSEDAHTGYQNPPNIRGLCDGDGTMTALPGSTNTCVISNVLVAQTATLRITKECATADANTQFTINLAGPNGAPVSLACGATSSPITINANTTYTVSETPPTGYQEPSIRGACDGNGTVSLAPNASGTCVVRNTKLATVVLQKECAQGDNGTGFVIHLTGPGKYGDQSATLNCGQSSSVLTVEANVQYTVSEDAHTGYQNPPNIRGLCDGDGTMTALPGSTNTCVISNVLVNQTATVRIMKECDFTDTTTDFVIDLTGPLPYGDQSVTLNCGETSNPLTVQANTTYTVSETPPAGFDEPSIRGLCQGNGTFSLSAGASGTCVVHNSESGVVSGTATLTINKHCDFGVNRNKDFTFHIIRLGVGGSDGVTSLGLIDPDTAVQRFGIGDVTTLQCGESDTVTVDANVWYIVFEEPSFQLRFPLITGDCGTFGFVRLDSDVEGSCNFLNRVRDDNNVSGNHDDSDDNDNNVSAFVPPAADVQTVALVQSAPAVVNTTSAVVPLATQTVAQAVPSQPTSVLAASGTNISPPRTGDAGLASGSRSSALYLLAALAVAAGAVTTLFLRMRRQR